METSNAGLMAIVSHEGIVLSTYLDSVKVPTIGIGHTAAAGWPDPKTYTGNLTISEALNMLRSDIKKYEKGVNAAVTVPLKQHEFDALVSFHYNTGAIGRASFVKKLNAGDRAGAIRGIMDWRKPPEIVPRRTAERDLFAKGIYPKPTATLYPATPSGVVQWGKGKKIDLREHLAAKPIPALPSDPGKVFHVEDDPPAIKPGPAPKTEERNIFWRALYAILNAIFGKGN